jgi:hypothetical protein
MPESSVNNTASSLIAKAIKYESNPEHPVSNAISQAVLKMASSSAMLYDFKMPFDALEASVLPASRLVYRSCLYYADLGDMNFYIMFFNKLDKSFTFFVSV